MQIILHIGIQKTASTLIQGHLAQNRRQLAEQGILYPETFGPTKTGHLKQFMIDGPKLPAPREELAARLKAEFAGPYAKAVLSDETIYPCSQQRTKRRIREAFEPYATSWRVLAYIRRPDEHIVSQYQQKVRNAGGDFSRHTHGSFDEFMEERLADTYYRYAHHMAQWAEVFGREAMEVRLFHRQALRGSPIADFLHWIGADPVGLGPETEKRVNDSLDRIGTEILLFLYRLHDHQPEKLASFDMRKVRSKLRNHNTDDRLKLDAARARRILGHFRADHEALAKGWLPPEHAALLLSPPAEAAAQPPVDPQKVHERMMAVFGDEDLARLAAADIAAPVITRRMAQRRAVRKASSFLQKAKRYVNEKFG